MTEVKKDINKSPEEENSNNQKGKTKGPSIIDYYQFGKFLISKKLAIIILIISIILLILCSFLVFIFIKAKKDNSHNNISDYISMYGMTYGEIKKNLKSNYKTDFTTGIEGDCLYLTCKDKGLTFVFDCEPYYKILKDIEKVKASKIILWNYEEFAGVPYGSKKEIFEEKIEKTKISGLTRIMDEDRIAISMIESFTKEKLLDNLKNHSLYIMRFNYYEYCLEAVFQDRNGKSSYLIISK
ncbi:hypothetical protein [Pseudobacteroides cellulosolvens]|uniref:Uncharacterized protein n=1 Tax=Pseudobacteroides cellulosolvens ATCC 35603 = DSM 2933 TaxID=398512 RepID=A0A0L6JHL5_9FIRM|nr:hypothetical protein [Pseudobacteroides cellulosolvens]KNY25351.1 hypothetical protein Bccel_0611 [Pseudobacteroides cellulosolvens ATCC 35603 = DSM 2933]